MGVKKDDIVDQEDTSSNEVTLRKQVETSAIKGVNPPLTLKETLDTFINEPGSGTLLLLGEAGLGKTLSSYQWADQLLSQFWEWLNQTSGIHQSLSSLPYLPLFIRPWLPRWSYQCLKGAVTKVLEKYGLDKTSTKVPLLIIIDGYDECQVDDVPQNLVQQLGLPQRSCDQTAGDVPPEYSIDP